MSSQDIEKGFSPSNSSNLDNSNPNVHRVQTSGANNEIVHIGDIAVDKNEFLTAFGGSLIPGYQAAPIHKFGNPAPLGLSAFALTTFVLSLVNCQARSVTTPSIVVGLAFFYGGLIQLLAGMWEIAVENTFGGTALSSYGGFWMSYAAIETDAFGIVAAYGDDTSQLKNAIGFYLCGWFIFTVMLALLTLKSTYAFSGVFICLSITFFFLMLSEFTGKVALQKVGGVFGLITAFLGWYNAYAGIANKGNSYMVIKPFYMPGARH